MSELLEKKCIPCRGDEPPLTEDQIAAYRGQVPDWELAEQDRIPILRRRFAFADFVQALAFTQAVGELAEEQDHHPVLTTAWGAVTVDWWTHKIKGLHENDFIMAAKTNRLYEQASRA